ncbi:DUF348 domain-containing protein [Nakamurella flavida]|uniref:DUF348 domain-containing protein n=1 Tax=Nakamurella flavida TaxID=363630 RepID=A0A938YMI5_9ACTN|nr:resuscitation-promoting factor [Nakamurella flavida]MBM9477281.1 DUF348 domain-containing protein [Nakamurella flavida]MDP9779737.1 uncharacterized protein YabE (DUF348 family) [Nakamurella flavida]
MPSTTDLINEPAGNDGAAADAGRHRAGRPTRRRIVLVAAATVLGLAAVGGGSAAALSKTVTITVDGQERSVTTLAGSVQGALTSAGLTVGEHDVIAPAPATALSDGAQVSVQRARLVQLTLDGQERDVWTTATTVEAALTQLGQNPADLQLSADRSREIPVEGITLTAQEVHEVTLTDGAEPLRTVRATARTVADLLTDQGIVLGPEDTVTPDATTVLADGTAVDITRTQTTTRTEQVAVAQLPDQRVDDPALNRGTEQVVTPGAPGTETVTYAATVVDGVQTGEQEVGRTVDVAPTATVIHVGTRSTLEMRGSRVFFNDTEFGVNWDGLAYCESTNNPKATFYPSGYPATFGLFQFDLPTWQSVDGVGNPMDASPEEQLMRAKMLYQKRGLEPWLCGYAAASPPPA